MKIDHANQIAESTQTKEDEKSRPPLERKRLKAFVSLMKDDLITMHVVSKPEYDNFITTRYRLDKEIGTPYTPGKYQQTKQEGICEDFSKGKCKKDGTCAFSQEEMEAFMRGKQEIYQKLKSIEKESENVDNESFKKLKEENVIRIYLKEMCEQVWNWNQKLGMINVITQRKQFQTLEIH